MDVYLEVGTKRVFACAVDWPGLARSGRSEGEALDALLEYADRYGSVVRSTKLGFVSPTNLKDLRVVERLPGNTTTDFGAPDAIPSADRAPATKADCDRLEKLLRAGWRALDASARKAKGKELKKGPRGGGRELDAILAHVTGAERGYLGGHGWKAPASDVNEIREAVIEGLRASARGEIPEKGPRGGTRWPARYFARRLLWHALAHVWE